MASLNLGLIQRLLWPLLVLFIFLSFSDVITTLFASVLLHGFVEFNPLGSALFRLGFTGFMLSYILKLVPVVPLFYMVAFRRPNLEDDFEVRLLKYAALVVLASADIFLGVIVLVNNLSLLLGHITP